jgi:hypothetical protein
MGFVAFGPTVYGMGAGIIAIFHLKSPSQGHTTCEPHCSFGPVYRANRTTLTNIVTQTGPENEVANLTGHLPASFFRAVNVLHENIEMKYNKYIISLNS